MALNLSSLLGQLNNNNQVAQVSPDAAKLSGMSGQGMADNSGLAILKTMLSGDTFTGKIMSLKDDTALIMLNDGSSVNARLSDNANVTLGQNMTFLVESNTSENISLKPLGATGQEAVLIDKALEAANMSPSESNINIVSNLLDMNMPINPKTISDMVKYSTQFPDKDLNTIANLMRLEIPVTEENIVQFDAYRNLEHSISGNFSALGEQIGEVLINVIGDSARNTAVAGQTLDFINTLYTADANGGNTADIPSASVSDILNENEINILKEIFANSDTPEKAGSEIAQKLNNNTATVRDVVSALTTDLKSDLFKDKPELKAALTQEITPKLAEQMINETLRITPENVAKQDGIKEYYKRVKSILEKAEKDLPDESFSPVNKNLNQVKANIDFMNDLNKNMTYFQMPVHFKHSNGDGELYVFTNKKALANSSDSVSAMLHLDMDNLGPIDIYVKMTGKNVSTNFCLESEELLDFVYSNIDKLNSRLEALGYNTKFEMNVTENKKFDFVDDFVEMDIPNKNKETSQYVFDIKA